MKFKSRFKRRIFQRRQVNDEAVDDSTSLESVFPTISTIMSEKNNETNGELVSARKDKFAPIATSRSFAIPAFALQQMTWDRKLKDIMEGIGSGGDVENVKASNNEIENDNKNHEVTWIKSSDNVLVARPQKQKDEREISQSTRDVECFGVSSSMTPLIREMLSAHKRKARENRISEDVKCSTRETVDSTSTEKNGVQEGAVAEIAVNENQRLRELYNLRLEDERSDRAKANVMAFERLYRRVFCPVHSTCLTESGELDETRSYWMTKDSEDANSAKAVKKSSIVMRRPDRYGPPPETVTRERPKCVNRATDSNRDIRIGDLYLMIRYQCAALTKESLFEHVDRLIKMRYSLNYLFAYMKYLRRKYRRFYPIYGNERRAFTRSILQRFFGESVRKLATDEIYSSDEDTYERIRDWCLRYLFNDDLTLHNKRNTRKTNMRFVYLYLMMYYTGKRLSELAILSSNDLARLLNERNIAIYIPKTRKLGRISLNVVTDEEYDSFVLFLERFVYLTRDNSESPYHDTIPFDQFARRKSLNRCFDRVYALTTNKPKPRGLSFHSLRRRKAAVSFERGMDLDDIREILDHSSTYITNNYINKHLVRTYKSAPPVPMLRSSLEKSTEEVV